MPVTNEGLGWDSLLKMVHNPGGDCYWVGGRPKIYLISFEDKNFCSCSFEGVNMYLLIRFI